MSNSKYDFQGHSKSPTVVWCHLMGHIRFPNSFLLQVAIVANIYFTNFTIIA